LRRRHRARHARDFGAALEQDHRRNAADAVARARLRRGVAVDLGEAHVGQLPGGGREVRRHLPARPAPGRPEVHEHGDASVRGDFLE